MKRLSLKTIIEAVNGVLVQGTDALAIDHVVTRPRRMAQGTLLFDLYFEGCGYLSNNRVTEAYAIVTDKPADFVGCGLHIAVIGVRRIRDAFQKFIDYYRGLFDIPVIGVTGTCGKTTTKEMIKHILSGFYQVNATYKSYNALFRNLRYLLEIDETTQAAVIEMGVAFPGDLNKSCRYFKPQIGVITNIGIDHLQGFRSLQDYIKAKAEMIEGMGYRGDLVLNADDQNIKIIDLQPFKGRIISFGVTEEVDYRISSVTHEAESLRFDLRHQERTYHLTIPGHAEFNLYNAAAAVAACQTVGIAIEEAADRLASFKNVEKHFEFHRGMNGSTVIDDTWSTNPTSIEAALRLLKSLANGRKTTAVLGKMSLLGKQSAKYHYLTGEKVADLGIDQLIVMGSGAEEIGHGALNRGMRHDRIFFCRDAKETYEVLKHSLDRQSIALVKTSMLASYGDLIDKIILKT